MSRQRIGLVKVKGRTIGWWERTYPDHFELVANFNNYFEELQDEDGLPGSLIGSAPENARYARREILMQFNYWLNERKARGESIEPYRKPSPAIRRKRKKS